MCEVDNDGGGPAGGGGKPVLVDSAGENGQVRPGSLRSHTGDASPARGPVLRPTSDTAATHRCGTKEVHSEGNGHEANCHPERIDRSGVCPGDRGSRRQFVFRGQRPDSGAEFSSADHRCDRRRHVDLVDDRDDLDDLDRPRPPRPRVPRRRSMTTAVAGSPSPATTAVDPGTNRTTTTAVAGSPSPATTAVDPGTNRAMTTANAPRPQRRRAVLPQPWYPAALRRPRRRPHRRRADDRGGRGGSEAEDDSGGHGSDDSGLDDSDSDSDSRSDGSGRGRGRDGEDDGSGHR